MTLVQEESSFRDNDGFIFYQNEEVYRAINFSYKNVWENLYNQDFFKNLIKEGRLPSHTEVTTTDFFTPEQNVYKVLQLQKIPFISYPNEWDFEQLKKAALLTLSIQKKALQNNFSLKDASAFNIQFIGHKAIFIDTLSFENYEEGKPWVAYGQFCRHFLAPLLLMAYGSNDAPLQFITHLDGIPLTQVSSALPWHTRFNPLIYTHIHLHARFETTHQKDTEVRATSLKLSKQRSLHIVNHLYEGIKQLELKTKTTNWTDYYATCSYTPEGYESKKKFVTDGLALSAGNLCVDLGANTGEFSTIASNYFNTVIACDSDTEVVRAIHSKKITNVLALRQNISNPTPSYGWNNKERSAFFERASHADMVMALALVHHLCIGNNLPLKKLASFFSRFAKRLIIEFVPKNDAQVKKLLVTRRDVFADYTLQNFVAAFATYYTEEAEQQVPGSERVLFLLTRKKVV